MAEQVNQRIEDMINELEQMRRTNLYNEEEIREISRKRKEFEYRVQRRVKQKEDYVHYIAYELALMEDITLRRRRANLNEKKKDLEYAIAKRLNKLFKQFIYRFQNDLEIYFQYIKFCRSVGFDYAVSAIIGQMLQYYFSEYPAKRLRCCFLAYLVSLGNMSCVVEGCKSHSGRKENDDQGISFHKFPKNAQMRNEWMKSIQRSGWSWNTHSRICSKHFTPDSFEPNEKLKYRRLKADAIPILNLSDTDMVTKPVPMDVCDAERLDVTSNLLVDEDEESHINICVQGGLVRQSGKMLCSTSSGSACNQTETIVSRSHQETETVKKVSQQYPLKINILREKPSFGTRQRQNTSARSACIQHEKRISQLEKELERVNKVSQRRLRKINNLTKRLSRLSKKSDDMYTILMDKLKQENIDNEYLVMLENINKNDIVKRFLQKQGGEALAREFSNDLKKFAVTLHYLSPKAYTFVREQFQDVLPHPKTITTWYKGVDCNPGFTSESFDTIKARVQQNAGKTLYCALAIDEMAIRKLVEWDSHNQNYYGFANIGCDLESDSVPVATQALTFMITCLNDTWKIPIGYFLIKSIKSDQKAALIKQGIELLHECGISVISLTFDGAASNTAMSSHLGCDMSAGSTSFQCGESKLDICLWPDPCHNIKLVRNALADKQTLIDQDNNIVSWSFIEKLQKLQEDEGLHLGNKLRRAHINFVKQKMKVRLATQLFSNSVADALQYCKEKGIPGFENCEGTITFIRMFNNLFDIFNSRNMRAKGWKRALAPFNVEETKVFFEFADTYIKNLKMLDGTYLIHSNRKTGFNGFLVCMKSLIKIYYNTVSNEKLQYLCTYKLSQDHLELFFGAIRSKCGFNNNPSARAFQAAYKRLLVHAQFKNGSSGNCIPLENIGIMNPSMVSKNPVDAINQSTANAFNIREEGNSELASLHVDLDHDYLPSSTLLSEYSTDIVYYMAGFVIRKLKKSLKCEPCIETLCDSESNSERVTLITIKNRGGLLIPSKDVFKICEATEKIIRQQKNTVSGELLGRRKHIMFIINKVCGSFIQTKIFDSLIEHSLEQTFDDNHRILLMKAICKLYLTARIHHIIKQTCVPHDRIRSFLTKTIIFKGQ